MSIKTIKYFSTIIVAIVAVLAGWWLWNYYMQSPWTRDGKIRAEKVSITPQVSGRIVELNIKDNQLVNAGDLLLTIDKTPFQIAELNAQANLNVKAMQASVNAAQATLKQTQWQLAQTEIRAPVSGWVTNLTTRIGDYADTGKPLFALVDSHSFYVIGYFEETKLRHIREGAPAQITLYSDNKTLRGHVSSIGRAIYDQSVESDSSLIPDVKPNVPWVRLAQRVPVRFALDKVPGDVTLVSGTTCSIAVGQ
ncbi:TPA: HlyD family secretion protein [Escherichia coli]|uniref:HlyD family efflux transporter periplasmic adaptor subunit n=1 Tax=Escherichia coli TaxID=562 RepID=UPI000CF2F5D1|nr:HlyD family secretion protein [Escherichia coli]EEV5602917.1 HlyD family secretion protein [Escherichia coli]EFA6902738.1 HlyD family secretion protein [Escherichia coli]EFO0042495.1 HlyD family secretion protein [Escherichia coli]EFO1420622.1 HlyD family secretion protein [Escherichia coli]EFO3990661.1 HlyD family secretion protein [Escherichia coli]